MEQAKTLSAAALAYEIGVCRATVYRMKKDGQLPPTIAARGRLRWTRASLEKWLLWDCPTEIEFRRMARDEQKLARMGGRGSLLEQKASQNHD